MTLFKRLLLVCFAGLSLVAITGFVSPLEEAAVEETAFDQLLKSVGLKVYYANLHGHHYMDAIGSDEEAPVASTPGQACVPNGQFGQDDGRPCRNVTTSSGVMNSYIPPQSPQGTTAGSINYLRMACEYAKSAGDLDILFITAHSKNGSDPDTDTRKAGFTRRHRLLSDINTALNSDPSGKGFYCGLGQEASSISTGNHINIMGQFTASNTPQQGQDTNPVYFPSGKFPLLYSQVAERSQENLILQINHPDPRKDLWLGDLNAVPNPKKALKELLNDYGLDDYAPVGCAVTQARIDNNVGTGNVLPAGCTAPFSKIIDYSLLKQTFENIRKASNNRHRLIELVSTTAYIVNPAANPPEAQVVGATTNTTESFLPVHLRNQKVLVPNERDRSVKAQWEEDHYDGLYNYIFYLAMGFKVGPTANQDNHMMNWGSSTASRTGVLAPSVSEADVLKALDTRKTFASEDRNAKLLLTAGVIGLTQGSPTLAVMGDSIETKVGEIILRIGYNDPDASDSTASLRVFYYRSTDELDFGFKSNPLIIRRVVTFDQNQAKLPTGPEAAGPYDKTGTSIKSGGVVSLKIPLEVGAQYIFVEAMQENDLDKIWSAPIWIQRN